MGLTSRRNSSASYLSRKNDRNSIRRRLYSEVWILKRSRMPSTRPSISNIARPKGKHGYPDARTRTGNEDYTLVDNSKEIEVFRPMKTSHFQSPRMIHLDKNPSRRWVTMTDEYELGGEFVRHGVFASKLTDTRRELFPHRP